MSFPMLVTVRQSRDPRLSGALGSVIQTLPMSRNDVRIAIPFDTEFIAGYQNEESGWVVETEPRFCGGLFGGGQRRAQGVMVT